MYVYRSSFLRLGSVDGELKTNRAGIFDNTSRLTRYNVYT